jgi:hypothetical protein
MGRACSTSGEKRNACRLLVGNSEGKRPLGRSSHRWLDIINISQSYRPSRAVTGIALLLLVCEISASTNYATYTDEISTETARIASANEEVASDSNSQPQPAYSKSCQS